MMGERMWETGSWKIMLLCVAVMALFYACTAQKGADFSLAGTDARVTAIDVETGDDTDRVIVETDPAETPYSAYKWVNPERVVLDISGASSEGITSTIPVADGLIQEVNVKQITGEETNDCLVRVVVALERKSDFEVAREDGKLVISFDKASLAEQNVDLFPDSKSLVIVDHGNSLSIASAEDEWAWEGPLGVEEGVKSPVAGRFAENVNEVKVEDETDLVRVRVKADGEIGDYSAFTLESPARLVVDLWGLDNQTGIRSKAIEKQGILRVRLGSHPDKLRMVFDAAGRMPGYRFDKDSGSLVVTFSKIMDLTAAPEMSAQSSTETAAASTGGDGEELDWPVMDMAQAEGGTAMEQEPQIEEWTGPSGGSTGEWTGPTAVPVEPSHPGPAVLPGMTPSAPALPVDWGAPVLEAPPEPGKEVGIAYIDSVKFDYSNDASSIIIHADRPIRREQWVREDNQEEKIVSIFLSMVQVAADQQRSYVTTEFQSPIELFSVFQRPNQPNEAAIVIVLREWAASKWNKHGNKLVIKFENYPGSLGITAEPTTGMFGPRGEIVTGGMAPAGVAPGVPVGAPEGMVSPEAPGKYTGGLISLDFKNLDILDALRTIADVSGMNIIVSDDVRGTVTIKLDSVPWDQALDLILQTKGLGKEQHGNVIRIAEKEKLQKEMAERLAEKEREREYEDLITKIIPLSYLEASDVSKLIEPILTEERGDVDTHRGTNSLIIRDVPAAVEEAINLINKLDKPTRQVLIEARIVEATVGVSREIGVRWKANSEFSPATGYPTGLEFPNDIQVGGAVLGVIDDDGAAIQAAEGGLAVGGGTFGMTVGSLTNVLDLDVMLRALESQEKIKIISSPRILTLTDESARIQQGISIPYPPPAIIGGTAVGWTFVEATLQLDVTPHITADNSIRMDVRAANNEPVNVVGSDRPGISKKEAETTILVNDGETAVIGGIFKITRSQPMSQVPFLGEIPIIGRLFQQRATTSRNEELLIFLTPQIVHQGGLQSVAGALSVGM